MILTKQPLNIAAGILGGKFGVKVLVKAGECPRTDGNCIILPDISETVSKIEVLGSLVHECAHVKHTDFSTLEQVDSRLLHNILNSLEDARIETLSLKEYPGASYLRSQTETANLRKLPSQLGSLGEGTKVCLYLLLNLQKSIKQYLAAPAELLRNAVLNVVPEPMLQQMESIASGALDAKSTGEVLAISFGIKKILESLVMSKPENLFSG